jgi:hypothetical protein
MLKAPPGLALYLAWGAGLIIAYAGLAVPG